MSTIEAFIPIVSWICLNAATGVLLTVPLRTRFYFLPVIVVPAIVSFKTIQNLSFIPGLSELWGTITFIGLIHFSSLLYIKQWTLRTTQRTSKISGLADQRRQWILMYKVATNPRFVRVPYKHVILSKQYTGGQINALAIHNQFSLRRVVQLPLKIGVYLLLSRLVATQLLAPLSITDFKPPNTTLFRRLIQSNSDPSATPISQREIILRIWFTVNSIYAPILLLDSIHTTLAIIFIYVLRIDIPSDWPDLFGSPLEAYNLGRFWSIFWHRVHLSGYSDYAYLLINVLPCGLTQNQTIHRALMTFLIFLISGLIHHFTSSHLNPGCSSDYGDIKFFCMHAVAVTAESALLQLCPLRRRSRDGQRSERNNSHAFRYMQSMATHMLGYLWVVGVFVSAVPEFYYPKVYCAINQQMQEKKAIM